MNDAAWRLVSYGNAFLLGRYAGDVRAKAALSRGVARWRFDTLQPRPHGIAPLRTVARDPYGWFRWLRARGYRRLTLMWLSAAEYAALDGPLKVFTTTEIGYMIVTEHARELPMVWNAWRVDYTSGWLSARAAKIEYRGSDVFALPHRERADDGAAAARLDAVLAEASALTPRDAATFAQARAALVARDPDAMLVPAELPALAPGAHPLDARRLMAAIVIARRAGGEYSNRMDGGPPRPPAFFATISDARLAAVNSLA